MTKTVKVGDTITRTAANGHRMNYDVIGFYADGKPKVQQYNATHSESCDCDKWED